MPEPSPFYIQRVIKPSSSALKKGFRNLWKFRMSAMVREMFGLNIFYVIYTENQLLEFKTTIIFILNFNY